MANVAIPFSSKYSALIDRAKQNWRSVVEATGGPAFESFVSQINILTLAATLVDGKGTYSFQLQKLNALTQAPYENKLDMKSVFYWWGYDQRLAKITSNLLTTFPFSYPEDSIFSAAGEANELLGAWFGANLQLTTNNVATRINSNLPQLAFNCPERIPAATTDIPQSNPSDEFADIGHIQVLSGADTNTFTLTWGPYNTTLIGGAADNNTLLIQLIGLEVQNGADYFDTGRSDSAKTC